jgi:hypothetical protein
MPSGPGERYDFFLSRRGSVATIARDVADVLTERGYKVLIAGGDWRRASRRPICRRNRSSNGPAWSSRRPCGSILPDQPSAPSAILDMPFAEPWYNLSDLLDEQGLLRNANAPVDVVTGRPPPETYAFFHKAAKKLSASFLSARWSMKRCQWKRQAFTSSHWRAVASAIQKSGS